MESIESFFQQHEAYSSLRKWALENCTTMDDVWRKARPEWLLWVATRDGVLDDKTLRLFACFCALQVRNDVEVAEFAERCARMNGGEDGLSISRATARAAAWVAAWASERAVALDAQADWLRENAKPNFKLKNK